MRIHAPLSIVGTSLVVSTVSGSRIPFDYWQFLSQRIPLFSEPLLVMYVIVLLAKVDH